jgi:hypothetical protein
MRHTHLMFILVGLAGSAALINCASSNPPAQAPTTTSGNPLATDPSTPPQAPGPYASPAATSNGAAATSPTSTAQGSSSTTTPPSTSTPTPSTTSTARSSSPSPTNNPMH